MELEHIPEKAQKRMKPWQSLKLRKKERKRETRAKLFSQRL